MIEEVVTDLIATQLMAVFSQNPDIEQDIRFQLMQEADSVMAGSSPSARRCMVTRTN